MNALRRSLAISIAGFFLPNLVAEFGQSRSYIRVFISCWVSAVQRARVLASLALFIGITIEN